ncbi:unnamed protein product [Lota lota]
MPSAHGQHHNVMMEDKSLERAAITQTVAESSVFICTECGEGFNQYHKILTHMALHGPLESFPSSSGSSNGFESPKEYVLQENGTLTMVNGSQSANVPSSTLSLASPLHPSTCKEAAGAKPTAAPLHPSPCKDAVGAKPTVASLHLSSCKDATGAKPTEGYLDPSSPVQNTGRGFECTLCFQIFWSREELRKHLPDHAHERFYCCGLCGKRFLTMDSLSIHHKECHIATKPKSFGKVENHGHKNEKTYPCKKCGSDFFWFTDFQTHSLYHCNGLKEVEKHCRNLEVSHKMGQLNGTSTDFKTLASSPEVTENASDCQSYQCGLCGDRFQKLVALKQHHLIHQTQEEMDQLNQEAQITFSRTTHMPNSMQERGTPVGCSNRSSSFPARLYPCKQCHSVFNHSSSLSRHMRYHKKTMHKCVFCNKLFPQRCDVAKHIDMHHQPNLEKQSRLKSMTRSSSFDSQRGLAKQEKRGRQAAKLLSKSMGKYKCEDCGKKFGLLSVYQRHLQYHKKEPTENLNIRFNNSSSLELHIKKDRGRKMAGVPQTTVQEKNNADIKDDNASHTRNDNTVVLYECNECTQTFSNLNIFLQHQNSHSFKNCG